MMPIPIDYKTKKEPSYYSGKKYNYSARKVVEDFDLSYNVGTAVSYLLRAGKKPNNPKEQDIRKAIDHLHFELNRIAADKETETNLVYENTDCTY